MYGWAGKKGGLGWSRWFSTAFWATMQLLFIEVTYGIERGDEFLFQPVFWNSPVYSLHSHIFELRIIRLGLRVQELPPPCQYLQHFRLTIFHFVLTRKKAGGDALKILIGLLPGECGHAMQGTLCTMLHLTISTATPNNQETPPV